MTLSSRVHKSRMALFLLFSCVAHGVAAYSLSRVGRYDVTLPVRPESPVVVELGPPARGASLPEAPQGAIPASCQQVALSLPAAEEHVEDAGQADAAPAPQPVPEPADTQLADNTGVLSERKETVDTFRQHAGQHGEASAVQPVKPAKVLPQPSVRETTDFLSAKREKLSYQISVLGVPAGNAVLEAVNNTGELRIISQVTSNPVFSAVYPVANTTDTRMFNGNYIITNIRQQEGASRSDLGYTLLLKEKKVFRADRIKKRYTNHPVPGDDILDIITGLYFLRRQPLDVGTSLVLNLFDSDTYAPATVRVLRRERVRLPDLRTADALVVQPVLDNDGFFHTTGDVFVWLTDDEFKVPVRVEASIALGRITVELTAAETERPGGKSTARVSGR
jgi:uncharacterized protein DUF3108